MLRENRYSRRIWNALLFVGWVGFVSSAIAAPTTRPILRGKAGATTKPVAKTTKKTAALVSKESPVVHKFVTNQPLTIQGNLAFSKPGQRTANYYKLQSIVPKTLIVLTLLKNKTLRIEFRQGGTKRYSTGQWSQNKNNFRLAGTIWSTVSSTTSCSLSGTALFCTPPQRLHPLLRIYYFSKTE